MKSYNIVYHLISYVWNSKKAVFPQKQSRVLPVGGIASAHIKYCFATEWLAERDVLSAALPCNFNSVNTFLFYKTIMVI